MGRPQDKAKPTRREVKKASAKRMAKKAPPKRAGTKPPPKRPNKGGRPKGTTGLTKQIEETILRLVRAGVFGYVAAGVACVPESTYYEWLSRGEGRSSRGSTPRYRRFAINIRRAESEARAMKEIEAYKENGAAWLRAHGRTKPGREGWTEPAPEPLAEPEERAESMSEDPALLIAELQSLRELQGDDCYSPQCSHPRCRCPMHKKRTER